MRSKDRNQNLRVKKDDFQSKKRRQLVSGSQETKRGCCGKHLKLNWR